MLWAESIISNGINAIGQHMEMGISMRTTAVFEVI